MSEPIEEAAVIAEALARLRSLEQDPVVSAERPMYTTPR